MLGRYEHISEAIGHTPLVRLGTLTRPNGPEILAKVEYFNPGGSVKDRIALRMIESAEEAGLLRPGSTIVEPTSGNTGVALALIAQRRGYRCIFICPDKVSQDKVAVLRAYGSEVVVCPTAVAPSDPRSYYSVADRITRETPGAWSPDQYSNPDNADAHYRTTGPEIWKQTSGAVTYLVAGAGTAGTLCGTGKYLKDASAGTVRVVAADPVGSVFSGGTGRPYLVEGVGEDFWPANFDHSYCDEVIAVADAEAFEMARKLAREEALLVGGSSGLAVAAALRLAQRCTRSDVIVVVLPDGGRGYISKFFDDGWMTCQGFECETSLASRAPDLPTLADVLAVKASVLRPLLTVRVDQTLLEAAARMRVHAVSHLPVTAAEPPLAPGEVLGYVGKSTLVRVLGQRPTALAEPVGEAMDRPLPEFGVGEAVRSASDALLSSGAVVILVEGRPSAIITESDVVAFYETAVGEWP